MSYKIVKIGFVIGTFALLLFNCKTPKAAISVSEEEKTLFNATTLDTVNIASDEVEYEIIIIEPGYTGWLAGIAKPRNYYSQSFLENRNQYYVMEWNNRVRNPQQFSPTLYELQIDYNSGTDYGYEVNYKLYNYFIYFQRKYNQRLGPFVPRI